VLSIGAASGGYYTALAHEDYYHDGGEPPSLWHGRDAISLGLVDQIDKDIFLNLYDGFSPRGEPLTQNVGKEDHRAGFDLTFSAPKSVSVLQTRKGDVRPSRAFTVLRKDFEDDPPSDASRAQLAGNVRPPV